jgi:hypothetical protein
MFMGSKVGADKIAAKRLGLSYEEYLSKVNSGLKWCTLCKSWKPTSEFNKDISRSDGLACKCRSCNYVSKSSRPRSGPSLPERRKMLSQGFKWCRYCKQWLPSVIITKNGICKTHAAEYARKRYSESEDVRLNRRQHSYSRKRNVYPIPAWVQRELLQKFSGKCAYCQQPATTWDHIVPVAKGGNSVPGNVVPCCQSCNSSKKDTDLFDWLDKNADRLNPHPELPEMLALLHCALY